MSSNDRRKIGNIVVDRGALVRLSIPFIWMAVISIGIVAAVRWQVLTALQKTELVGVENLP